MGMDAYGNQSLACIADFVGEHRFLYWWLSSLYKEIRGLSSQDTRDGLNQAIIGQLPVPLFDFTTQKAIAEFLDRETARIDQLIEKKQEMVEVIDQRATSLTWTLVTCRNYSGTPTIDSGFEWIGPIPASWRAVRIKTVARLESGHTPSRSNDEYWSNPTIPWVSLADTAQLRRVDVISETKHMISEAGLAGSSARILPAGTVAFTRDATVGLAAILGRDMAVSQHLVGWVCGPALDPRYLLHVIYAMQHELNRLTWGATIKTIGMPDLQKLSCPLPPLNEQRHIVQNLDSALGATKRLRSNLESSIERLRELRVALSTTAVTGQVDVATWGKRSETDRRLEAIEDELAAAHIEAAG
jgi:type I restriction enzyme, S subunit